MTTAVSRGFRCPALRGNSSVDMRLAEFTFVVEPGCVDGVDELHAVVEVFGFFCEPSEAPDDDLLQTGCLAVPAGSPIARIAGKVNAVSDTVGLVEDILRANIAACPCNAAAECPALNDVRLLKAIEIAAGDPPSAGSPPLDPLPIV